MLTQGKKSRQRKKSPDNKPTKEAKEDSSNTEGNEEKESIGQAKKYNEIMRQSVEQLTKKMEATNH
jgi:hypothetical protein